MSLSGGGQWLRQWAAYNSSLSLSLSQLSIVAAFALVTCELWRVSGAGVMARLAAHDLQDRALDFGCFCQECGCVLRALSPLCAGEAV